MITVIINVNISIIINNIIDIIYVFIDINSDSIINIINIVIIFLLIRK